jgi:hypothetical protein
MKVKDKLYGLDKFRNHLGINIGTHIGSYDNTIIDVSSNGFVSDVKLVYYNDSCCVFTNLKHGKSVFLNSIENENRPGTLVRFRDCADPFNENSIIELVSNTKRGQDKDNVYKDITEIVNKNSKKRRILFLVRDPLEKMLSGILQIGFQSGYGKEGTLLLHILKNFELTNPTNVKIIRNLMTKGTIKTLFNTNVDLSIGSPAYNALKNYFIFVIENYSYILLNDPHIYTLGNTSVRVTMLSYFKEVGSNELVKIACLDDSSDKSKDFINAFYRDNKITTPDNLHIDHVYRHSTYKMKPLLLDAINDVDINLFVGFANIISRENFALKELRREFNYLFA